MRAFADVRNHLAPKDFMEIIGINMFVYHPYSEPWLNNRLVKATPAFNIEMCNKFALKPVDFDGVKVAVFVRLTRKESFIQYVTYHETCVDLSSEGIVRAFIDKY